MRPDTTPARRLATARTVLFVPGDRPERFDKAAASGADLVVVDLEDAVAPDAKDAARESATGWLAANPGGVRINAADSIWFDADVAAVSQQPCVVMVPKSASPEALEDLSRRLAPGSVVLALVETAAGVAAAVALAAAPGVARLAFGSYDLAAELGVSPDDRDAMAWSRGALVIASAAAGLPAPFDGVTGDVTDDATLRDDVSVAARLGLTGKLCVHPRQVRLVHETLAPAEEELAWAREIVSAAAGGGVTVVGGRMVDKPVVDRARRLLASAPGEAGHETREDPA
jgi:citrate lyase subunit beta/citryl-CoA lyase